MLLFWPRWPAGEPMHGLLLADQRDPEALAIESLVLIWTVSEAEEWIAMIEFVPF